MTPLSLPCLPLPAVSLATWVDSVSALRLSCPPGIWNLGAEPPMAQGPCAVGGDGASVDAAPAVDRALDVCANVMMPAVSDMRESSVEVPGDFGEKDGVRVASPRVFRLWELLCTKGRNQRFWCRGWRVSGTLERELDAQEQVSSRQPVAARDVQCLWGV